MPRPPRFRHPEAIYHVFTRGAAARRIFSGDDAKWMALWIMEDTVRRHDWECSSWCLMNTHYHLLVATPNADISAGMKRLNWLYARTFNSETGGAGHVFAERYRAVFIQSDEHFFEALRYIVLNPVRAGICSTPDQWRWSSYTDLAHERSSFMNPNPVLRRFSDDPARARDAYRHFVYEGIGAPPPPYAADERIP
jgi:REP element-mobilizing transposase RayT